MNKIALRTLMASTVMTGTLLANAAFAADANLTTLEQKASYTLAADLANNFKKQGLEIDVKAFQMGLEDALNNQPMRLSADEMNQAVSEVKQQMIAKQQKRMEALAQTNEENGKKFLAENAKKDGVKTFDNGIQYKIMATGKGDKPQADDTVFAHYEGRLINGTVFDSSYERNQPLEFTASNVIPGWGYVIQQMRPGDQWEVFIPSNLAYGKRGAGEIIGPNEVLIFKIELVSVKPSE